jgi:hypothetical protein
MAARSERGFYLENTCLSVTRQHVHEAPTKTRSNVSGEGVNLLAYAPSVAS